MSQWLFSISILPRTIHSKYEKTAIGYIWTLIKLLIRVKRKTLINVSSHTKCYILIQKLKRVSTMNDIGITFDRPVSCSVWFRQVYWGTGRREKIVSVVIYYCWRYPKNHKSSLRDDLGSVPLLHPVNTELNISCLIPGDPARRSMGRAVPVERDPVVHAPGARRCTAVQLARGGRGSTGPARAAGYTGQVSRCAGRPGGVRLYEGHRALQIRYDINKGSMIYNRTWMKR